MVDVDLLLERLGAAGIDDVEGVLVASGGVVAVAGLVTRRDGTRVFAKTIAAAGAVWCSPRPPETERFFAVYAEVVGLEPGWEGRMPPLYLRELMSTVAHGDDDRGAADAVRELIAPFRQRP